MNLKEFSKLLGLSPATVSRALGGYPEVNEDTRRRVVEAASRHNYRPNTRAKSLATGRAMAVGHIVPLSSNGDMVNPIFGDFIAGAGETYSAAGYDMIISLVKDDEQEKTYRELAARRAVDGVIVHSPLTDDPRIQLLNEIGLPFVVHGRSGDGDQSYSWLDVNNKSAFQRATEYLIDLGHERIALLNGLEALNFAYRRKAGYIAALEARGLPVNPDYILSDQMTEPYGYASVERLLQSDTPPTAFLVSSIISAIGARRAVQQLGMTLARDVSIVTHDDALSYLSDMGDVPMFTATRSSVRAAGRRSAELLLDLIADPLAAPRQELWEAQLVLGASSGPAPV